MTKEEETQIRQSPKHVVKQIQNSSTGARVQRTFLLEDESRRQFRLFVRRSEYFPENFSVGINLLIDNNEIALRRYNGKHGETIFYPHHAEYHTHLPTWINSERRGTGLRLIAVESRYATMDEALTVACIDYRIHGMEEFYPAVGQEELHFDK